MRTRGAAPALVLVLGAALAAARQDPQPGHGFDARTLARIGKHAPLPPLPPDPTNAVADDPAAAWLGQKLFFDPALSGDGKRSCATCHDPKLAFSDGKAVSEGVARGTRNTPSLLDVARQRWFFWDGRADTLWSQALKPIESPIEMGGNRAAVVRHLRGDPELAAAYERVFGPFGAPEDRAAIDRAFADAGKALAAYERRLASGPSAFDRFAAALAAGDVRAQDELAPAARAGLALFVGKAGCRQCHSGPAFSDGEFHNLGLRTLAGKKPDDPGRHRGTAEVLADPFNAGGAFSDDPRGPAAERLATIAVRPESWGEFRTPSLRNVARTAPYMHQGQLASLADVVRFYSTLEGAAPVGHHQERLLQPLGLSAQEQLELIAFLESLSGPDPRAELCGPPQGAQPARTPDR